MPFARVLLALVVFCSSLTTSMAQSLYEQNMKLGQMFEACGSLRLAEQHYQAAIANAETEGGQQQTDAYLCLVRVLCFWRPVEAQRLNDRLEQACLANDSLQQRHLALDGIISFCVGNKDAFMKANSDYMALCQQNSQLPTTYDKALQAINETFSGFYSEALNTLSHSGIDVLTRHNLSIIIYERKGDSASVINELRALVNTCDSLESLRYTQNRSELDIATNMTQAQQKAESNSSKRMIIILLLLAVIGAMVLAWVLLRRRQQREWDNKNEQLMTALRMAGETDMMKKEFVRRVSHEIRTPLNAITGFNDILNNSEIELGKEERNELMGRINENVKAITSIVDELLQAANNESTLEYSKGDTVLCNQFLSDILYRHSQEVNANIELSYTTKVINRFTIITNAEALEKIVEHLIGNAIKFTQRGKIELNCREENNMVYITVTDTGQGVPDDKQDEIFEQFAKADAFQQGIGLGLAVSRKIAQKLGGDLRLDKDYRTGARFILSTPTK